MIAAVVLGAGKGTRMASSTLPKQFLNLGGSLMIVQTVEKFVVIEEIDKIVVVVSKPWMTHAKDLFRGKSLPREIDLLRRRKLSARIPP